MKRSLPIIAALLAASPIQAQQLARRLADGPAVGGSAGAFFFEGEKVFTIGLNVAELRAGRLSADFMLSLPPQFLSDGVVVLAADVAPAYNLSLSGATLLLKVGPSLIAGGGGGGGGALVGAHGGIGLVVQVAPNLGLRFDLLERAYLVDNHPCVMQSVSFGLSSLPGGR